MDCNKKEANGLPEAQMLLLNQVKEPLNEKYMPIKKRVRMMGAIIGNDDDDKTVDEGKGFNLPTEPKSGVRCPRCDFEIPPNRLLGNGSANVINEQNEALLEGQSSKTVDQNSFHIHFDKDKEEKKWKGGDLLRERSENENETKKKEEEITTVEYNAEPTEIHYKKKTDDDCVEFSNFKLYEFDKDRLEGYFLRDHLWAIYDSMDGMPRLYAQIQKVFSPGNKVRIKWLEAHPNLKDEVNWVNRYFPVSCGKFKHGKTEITEDLNMFSHSVINVKVTDIGLFEIYPRKAETWALFKNWDFTWSSDPDDHRNCEFEFVEILSDYDKEFGINVAYLEKVEGFMSLFRPKKRVVSYEIPSNELYRFSHRVPSYKTTGKERDGVPEGFYELDPASLPAYLVKNIQERSESSQQQQDRTLSVQKQPAVANGTGKIIRTRSASANPHREQNLPRLNRSTFWTACQFCNMRYQFCRDVLNRVLQCPHCMKYFIASSLDVRDPASLPAYLVEDFRERSTFPHRQQNRSLPVWKQPGVRHGLGSISRMQFRNVDIHHEQDQLGLYRSTFWTACPFCNRRHQYHEDKSRRLVCQNCMKTFVAYPLRVHDSPSGTKRRRA